MSGGDGPPPPPAPPRGRLALPLLLAAAAGALLLWEAADLGPPPGAPPPAEEPAALAARIDRGLEGVRARFRAAERSAVDRAEALVPPVLAAVPRPTEDPGDRAALFAVLSASLGEDRGPLSGAAVVDAAGRPLAWWGRIFLARNFVAPGERPSARVVRTNVYKVAVAEVPLTGPGGDTVGAVRVFAPFHANLPLHNRYLRRIDFESEAEAALGLERVNLRFEDAGEPEPDLPSALAGRGPLESVHGDRLGTLEVTVRPPEEADAVARSGRSRGRRGTAGALLVLGLLAAGPALRRRTGALAGAALLAGLVLAVRAAFLLLGVPSEVLRGEAFDLSGFSVPGLGGALRTPADALLSGAAAAAAALALCRAVPRPAASAPAVRRAAALVGAGVVSATGWLAVSALAEAVAFESRVDLFPDDRILPAAPAAALLLSVGLAGTAFLAPAARLLALAAGRSFLPASRPARWILAASAASFLSHMTVQWQSLRALQEDALVAAERLDPSREQEERAVLENLLGRLAGPDGTALKILRGRGPRPEDAAFFLWAGDPELNGRPDGCSLDILNAEGRILSRFDIDVPPRSWLPDPMPFPAGGPAVLRAEGVKGAAGRSFLLGSAPVAEEDGTVRGALRICIPAAPGAPRRSSRPEILQNYAGSRPPPEGRSLHRAVYDGDLLRECTNPGYPRGLRAPREAVDAVLRGGEEVLWVREEVGGAWYFNAYLPRVEGGRRTGMLSVGFPSLSGRAILLNLARVFFLHLLAAAALGAAAGGAALLRGRAHSPAFGFRAKVLAGFVLVGAVPVVGLALLERSLAEEGTADSMRAEVEESLRLAEASLRDAGVLADLLRWAAAGGAPEGGEGPDDRVKEIAYRIGVPVNLYLGDLLLASSERGIFATELFSLRMPGSAYDQVVLLGRGGYAARERFGSFPFLVGYAPVRRADGAVVGALSVPLLYRQDRADRDLARTTTAALALYLLVLLAVAGAGTVLARRVARPVESLAEGTRRVAAGDLDFRIPKGPEDELGNLVDSFNRMTEGLEAGREAAARAEREAAWREMAKQVAHEIKNPLTPMRLHAQHLLRAQQDGSPDLPQITEKAAETILRQTEALQRIASDFAAFARLPRRSPEVLDLAPMVRDAADLHRGAEGLEVVVEASDGLPRVFADREEMRLVLVNLCGNAFEAMPRGGRLSLRLRAAADATNTVLLEVEDTGLGIPPENLPRLFDPSFSTKTRGTGLGLAIVRRAVEDAGGRVEARSEVGKGAVFTVTLPCHPPA